MLRIALAGCLFASLSPSLAVADVCVACEKPAATYVCSLEQVTRDQKFQLGYSVQRHVCEKVLAQTHEKCRVVPEYRALQRRRQGGDAHRVSAGDRRRRRRSHL